MPLPKRRHSRQRRNTKRSHHHLMAQSLIECTHCGEAMRPHRICPSCGHYAGRQVVEIDEK